MSRPRIGDVYWADLGDPVGHEQGLRRPCVVISPHSFNTTRSNIATVLPVTSRDRGIPSHRPLDHERCGLAVPSWVRTEDHRAISQLRLGRHIGRVSGEELDDLRETLMILLEL